VFDVAVDMPHAITAKPQEMLQLDGGATTLPALRPEALALAPTATASEREPSGCLAENPSSSARYAAA